MEKPAKDGRVERSERCERTSLQDCYWPMSWAVDGGVERSVAKVSFFHEPDGRGGSFKVAVNVQHYVNSPDFYTCTSYAFNWFLVNNQGRNNVVGGTIL